MNLQSFPSIRPKKIFKKAPSLSLSHTNKHIHQHTKLTKPLTKHIKIQLQGLSCCSKESSPALCVLLFVGRGTRNQRALTCAGSARQACGESCTDSKPWLPCHAGIPPASPPRLPLPPPGLLRYFLISSICQLSPLTRGTIWSQYFSVHSPLFSIWFQHFKISRLTHEAGTPGASGPEGGGESAGNIVMAAFRPEQQNCKSLYIQIVMT